MQTDLLTVRTLLQFDQIVFFFLLENETFFNCSASFGSTFIFTGMIIILCLGLVELQDHTAGF